MLCPQCGGVESDGCPSCDGRGKIVFTDCPIADVGADVWGLLDAAKLAEKGLMPIAGGWLDQTAVCISGIQFADGEISNWKNRRRE